MKPNDSNLISTYDAAVWLARMAAADGVLTSNEHKILDNFSKKYGIDLNILISLAKNIASETPPEVICLGEEYLKGYEFEKFVVSKLCTASQNSPFSVIRWRGDKEANGVFASDDKKPDLHIRCARFSPNKDFYLECKYRSSIIPLASLKRHQILRYVDVAKADKKLAFIIVGLGGSPAAPETLYFVPLWEWLRDTPDFEHYRFNGGSLADFIYAVLQDYMAHMNRILHRS